MIILRQKEFGNKENKAAKRAYEIQLGKNDNPGRSDMYALSSARARQRKSNENWTSTNNLINNRAAVLENAEKEINVPSGLKKIPKKARIEMAQEFNRSELGQKYKETGKTREIREKGARVASKYRKKFYKIGDDALKKENLKKAGMVGGAALGTAALVGGGIAISRHNKKKKEEEEKKKKSK